MLKEITATFMCLCMWALSFPLLIIALKDVPPITLGALRTIIGGLPLFLFVILKKNGWQKQTKKDWCLFIALGLTSIIIPNVSQNVGMKLNERASISGILQSSGPLFTVLLAAVFLREHLTVRKIVGATVAMVGTILLLTNGFQTFSGGTFYGNLLVFISAISYGIAPIISKKALKKYDPITLIGISSIIGTIGLIIFSLSERFPVMGISPYSWQIIVILAVFPGVIATFLWYYVLQVTEASKLSLSIYLIPILTILFSYILLGEYITISVAFYAVLILGGVLLATIEHDNKKMILCKREQKNGNRSRINLSK